jgi:hypothetical protein
MIEGLTLNCEVNSAERAKRLRKIIKDSLPDQIAKYKTTTIESVETAMKNKQPTAPSAEKQQELMNNPEVAEAVAAMLRKHWETWPDIELPILHGKTPRQAVKTEIGRLQVQVLVEDAEANCLSHNDTMGTMDDMRKLRAELGL